MAETGCGCGCGYVRLGYRFRPTDQQLVGYFLHNKVNGGLDKLADEDVHDCDLYGEKEPWEIWKDFLSLEMEESEDMYFFTKLKRLTAKGPRISRKVGSGTWSGELLEVMYAKLSQVPIGTKRTFRYEKAGSDQHGAWLMHEFSLKGPLKHDDIVLCRLRKNDRHLSVKKSTKNQEKKRKRADQDQSSRESKLIRSMQQSSGTEEKCDLLYSVLPRNDEQLLYTPSPSFDEYKAEYNLLLPEVLPSLEQQPEGVEASSTSGLISEDAAAQTSSWLKALADQLLADQEPPSPCGNFLSHEENSYTSMLYI